MEIVGARFMKRVDLSLVYPPFAELLGRALESCAQRGAEYIVTSAFRDGERQAQLYAQGRTTPGPIVTNARPFASYHNFGIGGDACRDADIAKAGLQPDYHEPAYVILAEEVTKLGLEAGLYWKPTKTLKNDPPHVQLKLKRHDIQLLTLRNVLRTGGLPAVFRYLDKFDWSPPKMETDV